jgi:serine/threonine protein phosphatase PrpC
MYEYSLIIDRGIVRERNDDRICVAGKVFTEGAHHAFADGEVIAAVFDGVGGIAGGDIAAQKAAECLAAWAMVDGCDVPLANQSSACSHRTAIGECFDSINQSLVTLQRNNPLFHRASTTTAGIWIEDQTVQVFNAGDSRVYRYRDGVLLQLTKDHSVSQDMEDSGLAFNDAQKAAAAHVINRFLGDHRRKEDVALFAERPGLALAGDIFLLCTDGLSDVVSEEELEEILNSTECQRLASQALVQKAKANGSKDNISVLLIRCVDG